MTTTVFVHAALVAVLSIALTTILLVRTDARTVDHHEFRNDGDHHRYIRMATQGVNSFHEAPYCWRVAVPLAAAHTPWDVQTSFRVVSLVALAATPPVLFLALRRLGLEDPIAAVSALAFFTLGWTTKHLVFDFWLADAVAHLLLAAGLLAVASRRDLAFVAILCLGVTVKETVLALLPLYYGLRALRVADPALFGRTLACALAPLLVLAAIRWWIAADNLADYDYGKRILSAGRFRLEQPIFSTAYKVTVGTYNMAVFGLAVVGVRFAPATALRLLPFVLVIMAQLLLAYNTERLLVAGFPAALTMAGIGLGAAQQRLGWRPQTLAAALSPFFACLWVGRRLPELPIAWALAVAATAALVVAAIRWLQNHRAWAERRLGPVGGRAWSLAFHEAAARRRVQEPDPNVRAT